MPTSTDLVTDLPADFEVFGQAVDTSLADLKGGTTGQILSKTSNTDMDFTWTSANPGDITGVTAGTGITGGGTSGDVTVTNSMATAIDAKGDLIVGTAADTFSRLAVGATNGQLLTVDSAEATGLKWTTPSAAGANWSLLNAGGTALSGSQTIDITGISGKDKILVLIDGASGGTASSDVLVRVNSDNNANHYFWSGNGATVGSSYGTGTLFGTGNFTDSKFIIGGMSNNAASLVYGYCLITGCNSSGVKAAQVSGGGTGGGGNGHDLYNYGGIYTESATISSVNITNTIGNFDAGTVYVYASA